MAESVVTFFLQKLSDLITREANLLTGVDEQIKSLHDELEWIRSFLKDADGRRKENERVKIWVNQVRDVAYDAEDVIDKFILKVERQRLRTVGSFGSLRSCLCIINQLKTCHDVGNQIEQIKRRVADISANKSKYGIESRELGESSSSMNQGFSWKPRRGPVVEEADVVGIEDDAKTLVRQLTDGEARLRVISIVGMGGLGKTTLAKKVYNNADVIRRFDCRAWIYLSQEYRLREVLLGIINQFTMVKGEEEKMDEDGLRNELFEHLKERRYLVVVDDIWRIEAWESLKAIFPQGGRGSRVMLTTRNKEVALHAQSIPHELRFLREEECWELFYKKALSNDVTDVLSANLEKIGREIVAKCRGLPLAVVVLGGILSRRDKTPSEWAKVLKSINWQLGEGQNQISRILSLSYYDLPYYLKSCFLYFGVFPEDFEIPARKLIHLWVAEGFVQQRGHETMEEVAEDFLEELIGRSMVQVSKRRSNGGIKTCQIHDLLRDLSILEAKEDKFLDIYGSAAFSSPFGARRLTIHGNIEEYMSLNHPTLHLRSFLRFGPQKWIELFGKGRWRILFTGFRLLRVLDLPEMGIIKLPAEIGELIQLRYLGLRNTIVTRLPSTISNLINLQTLDLRCNYSYDDQSTLSPPLNVFSKMDQLRHLYMESGKISGGRFRIDCLRNLQTLSSIEAGSWIEDGLANLTNLRKLVVVRGSSSHNEALSNSIVKLDGLQSLSLLLYNDDVAVPTLTLSNHVHLYKLKLCGRLEKPLELHEFPPNLTHLCLILSSLINDPMATLENLPHLKILKLSSTFMGKEMVCTAEGFTQLKELELKGLRNLEEWKVEEGAMLSLRHLQIWQCEKLKMLPEGLQHVTTLQVLELDYMPEEFNARVENGEDRYKVQHIPSLIIKRFT